MWLGKIRGDAGETEIGLTDAKLARDLFEKLNPKAFDLRFDRAWNLASVAHLQELSGNPREANKSWRQAVAVFDLLAKDEPGRLDFRSDLAFLVMSLAQSSTRIGLNADAERDYRRAVDILERSVALALRVLRIVIAWQSPNTISARSCSRPSDSKNLTSSPSSRSRITSDFSSRTITGSDDPKLCSLHEEHRDGPARTEPRRRGHQFVRGSSQAIRFIASELARDPDVRQRRADTLDNLGATYLIHGRYKDAEPRIRQGLTIRESLAGDRPEEPKYQESFGMSKIHLGKVMAKRGELAEARRLLEQGVELETRAFKADPRNRDRRDYICKEGARLLQCSCWIKAHTPIGQSSPRHLARPLAFGWQRHPDGSRGEPDRMWGTWQ